MDDFVSGAIMMAYFAVAAFFLRYWKKSHDNLFRLFAASFFLLGLERIVRLLGESQGIPLWTTYLPRLVAFILIIAAIWEKNRSSEMK